MTVTVAELVPEASPRTQRAVVFPAGKFSRSNRARSRREECFIPKSVRSCGPPPPLSPSVPAVAGHQLVIVRAAAYASGSG